MSIILLSEAQKVLRQKLSQRNKLIEYSQGLNKYRSYHLTPSLKSGSKKTYYYLTRKGKKGRQYLGNDSNSLVNTIKEAKYSEVLLSELDQDIDLLKNFIGSYVIPNYEGINKKLPDVYRNPVLSYTNTADSASEWKERMEAEKARYQPYRPHELKYTASDGTKMRSLSEVIIANYLISKGITFIYELPLKDHGEMVLPDFTILSPVDNQTVIIIEHQGAMSSEEYQAKFIKSLLFYLKTKLVPNKDVFFTFSHLDGNLDLRQVDSILRIAFGFGA